MYRKVQIFVENRELELFQDEKIKVNSSVQNISDVGKVFTDFSQTFTIPCTPNNNFIFEHYYNNDVDNTIDHQLRRSARIEIDHNLFRTGKVQIEKGQIKDGFPNNYQVTFFGDVVTLKDLVGEDKLFDLDYTSLNHTYSGAEIQTRISSATDYDVRYPLITSGTVWQYGDATTNDIGTTDGAIGYEDLFPAVRVKSIFDDIASKYGLTFTGVFLNDSRFTKAFLWYKNKEAFTFYSQPKSLRFAESASVGDYLYYGVVNVDYITPASLVVSPYELCTSITHNIQVEINTGSSVDYLLDVYENGNQLISFQGNGTQIFDVYYVNNISLAPSGQKDITFQLRSVSSMTFSSNITYDISYTLVDAGVGSDDFVDTYTATSPVSLSTTATTDLKSLAPDMKIIDFINGIFNTFNLTCYGENPTTFRIEPLDFFYNSGNEYDVTEYIDEGEITIERPKLYKNISFEWEQSQSFMNREYFDLFRREYGNLKAEFDYDGGDFKIKIPFESHLHSRFSNTNLQVGYCLGTEPEYKNYIPKPTLLYQYDRQTTGVSFYFNNGTTTDEVTAYTPFGQDATYNSVTHTLNWGSEISSFELDVINPTLYRTYYESYILNLYNPKTRVVYVKAKFPIRILTKLKLNDSLIIRDKKYIINDLTTELTTGDCDLVLLSNWRQAPGFNGVYDVSGDSTSVEVPFDISGDTTVVINSPYESQFATPDDTTPTGQQIVSFTMASNTGAKRQNTFPITVTSPSGTKTEYLVIYQEAVINRRITENVTDYTSPRITDNRGNRILE